MSENVKFGAGAMAFGATAGQNGLTALNKRPDPLADVEYTDDLEANAAEELTEMQRAYRERAAQEGDRFKLATDSEFWFAVCFRTREEKESFLERHGLSHLGDKYIDGDAMDGVLRK